MQYLQPFLYFARKPKTGFTNVLVGCLCPLIPIMGEMVLLGYRGEVSDELERDPDRKDHPDFTLDRLVPYLQRGVWPYLARLLFAAVCVPPILALACIAGFGVHEIAAEPVLGLAVGAFVFLALVTLSLTILWPMEYHAQVTRQFAPLAELRFALRFARLCWFPTFVAVLMFTMFSGVLNLIGLALCYVGAYPAFVIQQMAEQHLMTQLYMLYLEEGGEPLVRPEVLEDRRYDRYPDERPERARRVGPGE